MSAEERLATVLSELKTLLPAASEPKGAYRPLVIVDKLVYTSGHLPVRATGELVTGRLGADLSVEAGYEAARLVGLAILATLRKQFGTLDRIHRVVKVLGVVNSTPDFIHQPAVINGCSELFIQIFGADAGTAARSALAAPTLPLGVAVEIEAVFELENDPQA
jgi:enamine deaminase RidA (YjgF/YER057c/UK114 family)